MQLHPAGAARASRLDPGRVRRIGPGRSLADPVRAPLEAFFKADLSTVRVHEGPAATALGALAFTLGEDLYFSPGRFDTRSREGLCLLGHELSHVLQQRAGLAANPYGAGVAIVQDPALEAEADLTGRRLVEQLFPLSARAGASPPGQAGVVQPSWFKGLFGGGGGGGGDGGGFGALRGLGQRPLARQVQQIVWVSWATLFQDPPTLLAGGDLIVPTRFPPAVHNNPLGTTNIPTVNEYQCTQENRRGVRLRQDQAGHAAEVRDTLSIDTRWAFFLPWHTDTADKVQLNDYVDIFLTDPLNGCGVIISGTRRNPTVIHANYYIGAEDAPRWRHVVTSAYLRTWLNQQREAEYNALALQLGLVNPYLYSPVTYYAVGRARVFGLRHARHGWRFYATDLTTGQKATRRIWPP